MGPATYALCAKPAIGPLMWMMSQCAIPPLFDRLPLAMETAGGRGK